MGIAIDSRNKTINMSREDVAKYLHVISDLIFQDTEGDEQGAFIIEEDFYERPLLKLGDELGLWDAHACMNKSLSEDRTRYCLTDFELVFDLAKEKVGIIVNLKNDSGEIKNENSYSEEEFFTITGDAKDLLLGVCKKAVKDEEFIKIDLSDKEAVEKYLNKKGYSK